ncbi:MAG: hypothetical protein EOP14_00145 [Pseudomonas sp.]|nr:MAG: hypothetical protein EOP14_00145 [Pseudomonas sp.]
MAEWRAKNADHVKEYSRVADKEYRSKAEVQLARWMRNLHENYKMSPQDFNALWTKQEGKCEVCAVEMAPRGKQKNSVCVDHNHSTGEVRGLLCRDCNRGLGVFRDNPTLLEAAAKYLRDKGHYGHDLT